MRAHARSLATSPAPCVSLEQFVGAAVGVEEFRVGEPLSPVLPEQA
jgi:hypothetical protein